MLTLIDQRLYKREGVVIGRETYKHFAMYVFSLPSTLSLIRAHQSRDFLRWWPCTHLHAIVMGRECVLSQISWIRSAQGLVMLKGQSPLATSTAASLSNTMVNTPDDTEY